MLRKKPENWLILTDILCSSSPCTTPLEIKNDFQSLHKSYSYSALCVVAESQTHYRKKEKEKEKQKVLVFHLIF